MERKKLSRFAWLSIGAAILTIGLKAGAAWITGSVGLLSDALEGLINLAAALMALMALTIAARPPDEEHEYGHDKIEYFSSGVEGTLILIAALSIAYTSIERFINPQPLKELNIGLLITVVASIINLVVARILIRVGHEQDSITLEADGQHLMTDVWTSVGVVIGVGVVALTDLDWLDPVIALGVAANIIREGLHLVRRSISGLMDTTIPQEEREKVEDILERYESKRDIQSHQLRTRRSASRRFIEMHILVPGDWTVQRGHDLLERVEADIRKAIPDAIVSTHLEPVEDEASWQGADHLLSKEE